MSGGERIWYQIEQRVRDRALDLLWYRVRSQVNYREFYTIRIQAIVLTQVWRRIS